MTCSWLGLYASIRYWACDVLPTKCLSQGRLDAHSQRGEREIIGLKAKRILKFYSELFQRKEYVGKECGDDGCHEADRVNEAEWKQQAIKEYRSMNYHRIGERNRSSGDTFAPTDSVADLSHSYFSRLYDRGRNIAFP